VAPQRSRSRWAHLLDRYLVQNPDTAWQTLDGEAVVVTPADSKLHTLNETATFLWELAERGEYTVAELVERLRAEFEVGPIVARRDACRLAEELVAKGLAVLRDAPGRPPAPWDE